MGFTLFVFTRVAFVDSRPKTKWAGVYCVVVCTVALRANMVEASMPSHGLSSSNTMSCILKVRKILPIVWCTRSNMEFAWGFLEVIDFTLMP